jgi:hypothetical protein
MVEVDKVFSRAELCRRAGIHFQTIASLTKRGIIVPVFRIGGISYYDQGVVDSILEYYRVNPKRGRRPYVGNGGING